METWKKLPKEVQDKLERPLVVKHTGELKYLIKNNVELEYCFFWGHTQRKNVDRSCLSQWYPIEFEIDGVVFKTMEHYMMWKKAQMFEPEKMVAILEADSPKEAKALGRSIKNFNFKTWSANIFSILVDGNYAKFSQNFEIRNYLRGTLSKVLVEASPYDKIYGIGFKSIQSEAKDPYKWTGQNKLGYALMHTRRLLANEAKYIKGIND